jgi:nucleoside-diphosphate-sugar epimerase
MTTVAVTGASGYLGRKLVCALEDAADISRVIGIDIVDPDYTTRQLEFYRMDVRSQELGDVLRGCDVLVHLAVVHSSRDADEMRDVNVGGTRLALEAAGSAGVRKIVHMSDAVVYGAHPDNDFPLTEASLVRPFRELPYVAHKAEAEEIARAFAAVHPDIVVTVLRSCLVLGPTVSGPTARLVESPVAVQIEGYDPPVQVLHEDDAASALAFVVSNDLAGVYNLCPKDWTELSNVIRLLGQRRMTVGRDDAKTRLERLRALRVSELDPADAYYLMYPWVASPAALQAAGSELRHSTEDALRAAAEARRGWVAVGRYRFRPRRAALIAGSFGLALLGSAARRAATRARVKREKA